MATDLKHIDLNKPSFMANGAEYLVKSALTLERFIHFEKLQQYYGFGITFNEMIANFDKAIEYANKGKGVEAWNVIYNMREGVVQHLENRKHPALLLCSLFIVTKDEDLTVWDEKEQQKKIDDWAAEGIDVMDFFHLASNLTPGFIEAFDKISQSISGRPEVGSSDTGRRK